MQYMLFNYVGNEVKEVYVVENCKYNEDVLSPSGILHCS